MSLNKTMDRFENENKYLMEILSEKEGIAFKKIYQHLTTTDSRNLNHLTIMSFNRITSNIFSDKDELLPIVMYFVNKIKFLDICYEFIDDDNKQYPLMKSELREIIQHNEMIHPITNRNVNDFKEKIFIYFTASDKLVTEYAKLKIF